MKDKYKNGHCLCGETPNSCPSIEENMCSWVKDTASIFQKVVVENEIESLLNWMNKENFQPSSDNNTIWVHVGSNGAEEYTINELIQFYKESK